MYNWYAIIEFIDKSMIANANSTSYKHTLQQYYKKWGPKSWINWYDAIYDNVELMLLIAIIEFIDNLLIIDDS